MKVYADLRRSCFTSDTWRVGILFIFVKNLTFLKFLEKLVKEFLETPQDIKDGVPTSPVPTCFIQRLVLFLAQESPHEVQTINGK